MIAPFEYHRPERLDEALELLARYDDDAALYLGGTELLLVMKLGFAAPGHLIDGKRLEELQGVSRDDDDVVIGAGVAHRVIEHSEVVGRELPELARMTRQVANVRVRNVGTLGGNLCFAEPHSDPATLLIALGASVDLASPRGVRTVAVSDFFTGPLMTVLEPDEIMLRVRIPVPAATTNVAYERIKFRERPVVNLGLVRSGQEVRVVVGAAEAVPRRVTQAEHILAADAGAVDAAAAAVRDQLSPQADLDGSEDYKRHLAGVLLERAVARSGG